MATPAQINANRLNAQRSTGPRSEEGKAASRFNALKYGIEARSLVIPGEDPAAFEALAQDYREQFHPVGPLEDYLVETLVQSDWNRRRLARIQAQVIGAFLAAPAAPAESPLALVFTGGAAGPDILYKLHRQLAHSERTYFRALTELRRARRERQDEEPSRQDPGIEAPLRCAPTPPAAAPVAAPPRAAAIATVRIGFVPSVPAPANT
ncbi:MAG: hypothetical protein LAQ30_05385 [Acidobacteriia bacterium]|nr:hypothetical protein [Terriglobia bacterium]